ncbi:hypothetical protein GCM10027167_72030 [Nocardia heshunensis]
MALFAALDAAVSDTFRQRAHTVALMVCTDGAALAAKLPIEAIIFSSGPLGLHFRSPSLETSKNHTVGLECPNY